MKIIYDNIIYSLQRYGGISVVWSELLSRARKDKDLQLTELDYRQSMQPRWLERYRVPAEQMIVIYDDIDLPPGKIRVRSGGGPGTHNGMRSIVGEIGTESFPRIRVGTGDRPKGEDLVKWVLGRYGAEEQEKMDAAFDTAAECAMEWAEKGIDAAMRLCAGRKD